MKRIHLSEERFNKILSEAKELPFQTFYEETLQFIRDLLNKPIEAKTSDILTSYGLDTKTLKSKLCDFGVITKNEDIREPYDDKEGKQKSRYYISYKVPRENFKEKLRDLFKSFNNVNETKMRDEIDIMLKSPTTIGVLSQENAPTYVKQARDIYNKKINKRKKINSL